MKAPTLVPQPGPLGAVAELVNAVPVWVRRTSCDPPEATK